jgi:hypothetical protein
MGCSGLLRLGNNEAANPPHPFFQGWARKCLGCHLQQYQDNILILLEQCEEQEFFMNNTG